MFDPQRRPQSDGAAKGTPPDPLVVARQLLALAATAPDPLPLVEAARALLKQEREESAPAVASTAPSSTMPPHPYVPTEMLADERVVWADAHGNPIKRGETSLTPKPDAEGPAVSSSS
jgi:hypothetical protein